MRISLRKRVLHLVFSIPAVAQQEDRQPDALLPVARQQLPKCVLIAIAREFDELLIGKARWLLSWVTYFSLSKVNVRLLLGRINATAFPIGCDHLKPLFSTRLTLPRIRISPLFA